MLHNNVSLLCSLTQWEKKRGGWGQESYKNSCLSFLEKMYKIVAQKQVETLVFLNFIPAFPGLLNVLTQAFYFIYLSAK